MICKVERKKKRNHSQLQGSAAEVDRIQPVGGQPNSALCLCPMEAGAATAWPGGPHLCSPVQHGDRAAAGVWLSPSCRFLSRPP
jgi:hypothetical protein